MTKPFSPAQKFRILVTFDAQIIVDGSLVPVSRYAYGTSNDALRFRMLRRSLNCAVKCACGCDTWAPLHGIQFDHRDPHCYGGATHVSNGRPLTVACHRKKSRVEHAATARDDRIRRKLSVTTGVRENDSRSPARNPRQSWPKRSLTNPKWKKCFGGRVERRAP